MAFGGPPQQRPNKHSFPSEEPRSRRASDRRQPPPAGAKRKKGRAAAKAKAGTFDAMGLLPDVLRGIRRKVRRSSRRDKPNIRTPNQARRQSQRLLPSAPPPSLSVGRRAGQTLPRPPPARQGDAPEAVDVPHNNISKTSTPPAATVTI